ncbi:unnamed protein product [Prunus armeniaca]|uniref:Uncharacterized protein n=1 Tax=Prunus armeniaca TaxID=36596 RepID=A0A6J5VPX0_PRUAR|nr:unnamed protein product [Prunus armeniaca]CAB4321609.1 unnamed protein product [Prunus armeniaca]
MKSDEGTPPPQLSEVESQLSDVELSGSNKREENKDEIYPSQPSSLLHDVPIPPPSPMEQ